MAVAPRKHSPSESPLLLGPIAGVLADRFDRRYTMVVCDLVRFVLFGDAVLDEFSRALTVHGVDPSG